MIEDILNDIGAQLRAQLPWVTETVAVARQDVRGVVLMEKPEQYAGIDDTKIGRVYFRFRDGWDATYAGARQISGPDTTTTEQIRGVLVTRCKNIHEIARFLALGIMNARNHADPKFGRYFTTVLRRSTDKPFIVEQETKGAGDMKNDDIRLVMVDFDVTYRDAVLTGEPTCVPPCNGC